MQGGLESLLPRLHGLASLPYQVTEEQMVPATGIGSLPKQAEMLAQFGRDGDTYIVHVAEGETVVPMEVFESNPRLKDMVWQQLRDMNLDPEQYVVGNEFNSINPITGQPEFGLKRLFKKLGRVVKKAIPIVATIIGGTVAGPWGAAIGSGLGAKATGASTEDALKAAALAGIGHWGTNKFSQWRAGQTPGTPVTPGTPPAGSLDRIVPGDIQKDIWSPYMPKNAMAPAFKVGSTVPSGIPVTSLSPSATVITPTGPASISNASLGTLAGADKPFLAAAGADEPLGSITAGGAPLIPATTPDKTLLQKGSELVSSGIEAVTPQWVQDLPTGVKVGGTLGALAYFDAAEREDDPPPDTAQELDERATTGMDLLQENPQRYGFDIRNYVPQTANSALANYTMPQPFSITNPPAMQQMAAVPPYSPPMLDPYMYPALNSPYFVPGPQYMPVVNAASGGEIVGPGTGTSDSVPAMLSDGEFVFTERAVKGAGNGDRRQGAAKMYAMMRQFEGSQHG